MSYHKLGRNTGHRRAMMRNLVTSVIKEGRVVTTEARAEAVRPVVEHLITMGKKGDLAARRQALAYVWEEDAVRRLFDTVASRYERRPGGYTRIIKLGYRRGDAARMAILELV